MQERNTTISFGAEAREGLLRGLNKTSEAVSCTLGPKGRTVLIQGDDGPIVTKDGVTVSKSIKLKDPLERMGSMLVQEAAARTNDVAGDGTTTATLLTQAMVNQGAKMISADMSALAMCRGLNVASDFVLKELLKRAHVVGGPKEIAQVATISANGDEHIGELISSAMKKVGSEGIITVEDAKGMNTSVEFVEGMQFDRGYLSPYFVTDNEKMIASYEHVVVLVIDNKVQDIHELIPILEQVARSQKPLLIIADEVEGTAIQGLVLNRTKSQFPVVAIKSPGYGQHKLDLINDICKLTGATLVSSTSGVTLKSAKLEHLGTLKKVVVSQTATTLVGDGKHINDISKHVDDLKAQLGDVTADTTRLAKLKHRIAGLAYGVAIIKVGGATELEMIERKYRIEDALNATQAAAQEGIIPGGGVTLLRIGNLLDDLVVPDDEDPDSFQAGVKIAKVACFAPLTMIAESSGRAMNEILGKIGDDDSMGFDARKGEFANMIDAGIIDPVKVTRSAFKNAVSVTNTFLTLNAAVINEEVQNGN